MSGNIHRAKTTHGKATDAAIRCFRNSAILLINILNQVDGNIGLDELALVKAVAPLAYPSWMSIAIRQYQDKFGYLAEGNEGVSRLIGLTASKPIVVGARCSGQKIERGIVFCFY